MSNYDEKENQVPTDSNTVEDFPDNEEKTSTEVLQADDTAGVYTAADTEDERDREVEIHDESDESEDELDDKNDEFVEEDDNELDEESEKSEGHVKKKSKFKKIAAITIGSILGVSIVVYLGLAFFFKSHYYFNTEINGTDFSGKTVKQVEEYMAKQVEGYVLDLKAPDGEKEKILGSEIGLEYQPGKELSQYMEKQNPFLWPQAFWKSDKVQASIGVKYDKDVLNDRITKLEIMKPENQTAPVSAVPVFNGTEYVIQPETPGTQIDEEIFRNKAAAYISEFKPELDMEAEKCYTNPRFNEKSPEVVAARDTMNSYLNASITYNLNPNTEVVDRNMISQWIRVDENMAVSVNRDLVAAYVADLASRYDTVGTTRTIQTPSGKTARVSGGSYGWRMNQEAEIEELLSNITKGEQITREPVFSQRAILHAANDWGNTFIEVDLSAQHMWFISDGKNAFEASVVTGKPDPSHRTPAGIFSILEKMRNKVLRGNIMPNGEREYETPVSYWMRVTWSGVGFHDATWQSAFGGTRYKDGYGSHGCINMTYSGAATLYNMIYVGVPVIIHY